MVPPPRLADWWCLTLDFLPRRQAFFSRLLQFLFPVAARFCLHTLLVFPIPHARRLVPRVVTHGGFASFSLACVRIVDKFA